MIQIRKPTSASRAFLEYLVNAINTNFGSVSNGGYDGDPATVQQDSTHRFVSDAEKTTWNGKAAGTHSHAIGDVTSLQTTLDGKATSSHTHAQSDVTGLTAALAWKSDTSHNHSGIYEPANVNIQAHVTSTHAPSTAQKNSDITKAEIEAKLTGLVTSHTHNLPAFSQLLTFVAVMSGNVATGANTTPVSMTDLVFTFEANSKYRIWFMGLVQPGAATTGCGFQFDVSVAVTAVWVQFFHQLASTGTQSGGHSIADDASVGVSSGFPARSTYPVNGFGYIQSGANAGTAQLRLRSETTAAVTALAGFCMVVEKIA